ncbi:MAG: AAA family ATPase [Clostridiales bacterium]|nr:AAA family ATPase [Clostridiales bacterium]
MDFLESDNFNAEQIAEEAEHLRRVLDMINEQIELLENDGFVYRTVDIYDENDVEEYRTDKFRHDARKRDIAILKKSLSTPYFARMKLVPTGRVDTQSLDAPSMTRMRSLGLDEEFFGDEADIYVGANVIVYKDKIIVFSHNSPLGNKVYERFENGTIEYGGYEYKVVFRRKFDIRNGKLEAVFQDYSIESGGVVYDKFLAHMLEIKRGDKRLTDIIPTIQANQNAIIIRPADENCVVSGCAGCGKTMLLLQRLEYLSFNNKLNLNNACVIAPSERYIEHIQPVVDDLMINAARRMVMPQLYRELILSLHGIKASERKALSAAILEGDESLPDSVVSACYGDAVKRKLIAALGDVKKNYKKRLVAYRDEMDKYERELAWARGSYVAPTLEKPRAPVVAVDLKKLPFIPELGSKFTKCKLYLLLTAYCYILGKPSFDGALFIDEGQDYFLNEYKLLAECTAATVNIYGDVNQQIDKARGIGDFAELDALWNNMQHYSLNENYRNAREITEYVNKLLGMTVTSLGLDGGSVQIMSVEELPEELKNVGDDRVAVIYSPSDIATRQKLEKTVPTKLLYTVAQCKGMEYERVYACGELTDTEKYVAYTRALAKLYICA